MKSLILLALLGVAAAQYTFYPGYQPLLYNNAPYHPFTTPYTPYTAHYTPYTALHPAYYAGLPYSFQPLKPEEKPAEEESPVVEATRRKRDVTEAAPEEEKKTVAYHVATPYTYPFAPYTYQPFARYAVPTVKSATTYTVPAYQPLTYSHFPAYTPYIHHLKKRDTAAAEEQDQQADDALVYTTYAGHPYTFPTAYAGAAYPAIQATYSNVDTPASTVRATYSAAYPQFYHAGYPFNAGYRYFY